MFSGLCERDRRKTEEPRPVFNAKNRPLPDVISAARLTFSPDCSDLQRIYGPFVPVKFSLLMRDRGLDLGFYVIFMLIFNLVDV